MKNKMNKFDNKLEEVKLESEVIVDEEVNNQQNKSNTFDNIKEANQDSINVI